MEDPSRKDAENRPTESLFTSDPTHREQNIFKDQGSISYVAWAQVHYWCKEFSDPVTWAVSEAILFWAAKALILKLGEAILHFTMLIIVGYGFRRMVKLMPCLVRKTPGSEPLATCWQVDTQRWTVGEYQALSRSHYAVFSSLGQNVCQNHLLGFPC